MNRFTAMGCEIVVVGARPSELLAIERLFHERDGRFSRFRADSELSRVNRASGWPVVVSPDFLKMTELALWAAEETAGLVDPTLGGALVAAGYDRDFAAGALDTGGMPAPGDPGCRRALSLHGSVLRVPHGVLLDLNAVVKSRTVDESLALMRGSGWISAGGDLATRGGVGVALPGGGDVHLVAGGIATSGRTRRSWNRADDRCHHLIDAHTGRPSRSCWQEVTVSGATCVDADVAAKAAFFLGEQGPAWLDARGLPGRFLDEQGRVVSNTAWQTAVPGDAACT